MNACGKFPSIRFASGSYSSEIRPRSFRRPRSRVKSARASSVRPSRARSAAYQNEQGRNAPSPGGRPSTCDVLLVGLVAHDQAVPGERAADRLDRAHDAFVLGGQEADQRDQQQARVQTLRAVRLDERLQLGVEAVGADVGVDLLADRAPAVDRARASQLSHVRIARSNATHAMTFECVKCRFGPRTSQMPAVRAGARPPRGTRAGSRESRQAWSEASSPCSRAVVKASMISP